MIPKIVFLPASPSNELVMVPIGWWRQILLGVPTPFRAALQSIGRFGSISGVQQSPIQQTMDLVQQRLGATKEDLGLIGWGAGSRQFLVLTGTNVIGGHMHPTVQFACKIANSTFVPLCWPIMAAMLLARKVPSTQQILICVIQTAMLEAFKKWCQRTTGPNAGVGTPAPYLYPGRRM